MDFKIVSIPLVDADVEDVYKYYEKRAIGLGKRFYYSYLQSLNEIQSKPFTFSYYKNPVRRYLMKKFSYKIYYIMEYETIFILGVLHSKRSNAFVKRRLKGGK